jgi:hypothetical protein
VEWNEGEEEFREKLLRGQASFSVLVVGLVFICQSRGWSNARQGLETTFRDKVVHQRGFLAIMHICTEYSNDLRH